MVGPLVGLAKSYARSIRGAYLCRSPEDNGACLRLRIRGGRLAAAGLTNTSEGSSGRCGINGWFSIGWSGLGNVALRSALVYVVFLVGLRLFGKREVGQFTFFDLALVLLLANALQPAMTGPDTTVGAGLIIIAVLLVINYLLSRLRLNSPLMRRLLEGQPTVILQHGVWMERALRREGLDEDDAMMALASTASTRCRMWNSPFSRPMDRSAWCRQAATWSTPSVVTTANGHEQRASNEGHGAYARTAGHHAVGRADDLLLASELPDRDAHSGVSRGSGAHARRSSGHSVWPTRAGGSATRTRI